MVPNLVKAFLSHHSMVEGDGGERVKHEGERGGGRKKGREGGQGWKRERKH
jgi:hypothetical protein